MQSIQIEARRKETFKIYQTSIFIVMLVYNKLRTIICCRWEWFSFKIQSIPFHDHQMTTRFLFVFACVLLRVEALRIPKSRNHFTFQSSDDDVMRKSSSTNIINSNIVYNLGKQIVVVPPQESSLINDNSDKYKYMNLKRNLAILSSSMSIFVISCLVESNYVAFASSGEEAVQLLYGYHTNIPSALTWAVLLYGAYKTYFTVFRWLASW